MFRHLHLLLCCLPALPTFAFASDGKASGAPGAEPANERGLPALFSWGDADGDGRLDLAAVGGDGRFQLLVSAGEGRFEEATERSGLAGVANVALALWGDYDNDGHLDLFVGVRVGASRLYRNEGGIFVDMSAASGLALEGAVQSAQWLDHDGDGRLDLFLSTAAKDELYRGLEGGFFERVELPLASSAKPEVHLGSLGEPERDAGESGASEPTESSDEEARHGASGTGRTSSSGPGGSGSRFAPSPTPGTTGVAPLLPYPIACANSIRDQAVPSTCVSASTTPTLGRLYPISTNLFVAAGGNVGIGTTSPTARLEVAGTARVTDTLTLNPSGDQALDVSTGSLYKGGALFIHTKGGAHNTALGRDALASATTGSENTATGYSALSSNTTGALNTACGAYALLSNTTGFLNSAFGQAALYANTTGSFNAAMGNAALAANTTGEGNTAFGLAALQYNTSADENTATGYFALSNNTTGYSNTASGANTLYANSTGHGNSALGSRALENSTTGSFNTALGFGTQYSNTTGGSNTACGHYALFSNTTGSRNVALGRSAGSSLTTGNDNVDIANTGVAAESATVRIGTAGTHTRAFLAGIRGVTTANANAIPVLVDSAGQLGTVSSSRRFKEEIEDMGERTERLLALRPVTFRYKPEVQAGERPLEYGLIAEEVAEVFPELVVYDEEGKPFTVKYHLLSAMLLNELQRLNERSEAREEARASELEALRHRLEEQLDELRRRQAALEEQQNELTRLRGLESRLEALESRTNLTAPNRDSP